MLYHLTWLKFTRRLLACPKAASPDLWTERPGLDMDSNIWFIAKSSSLHTQGINNLTRLVGGLVISSTASNNLTAPLLGLHLSLKRHKMATYSKIVFLLLIYDRMDNTLTALEFKGIFKTFCQYKVVRPKNYKDMDNHLKFCCLSSIYVSVWDKYQIFRRMNIRIYSLP